jgi:hypothetical protein
VPDTGPGREAGAALAVIASTQWASTRVEWRTDFPSKQCSEPLDIGIQVVDPPPYRRGGGGGEDDPFSDRYGMPCRSSALWYSVATFISQRSTAVRDLGSAIVSGNAV